MAYKSLIDYYGGGMVKPSYGGAGKASKGYYVGGVVSGYGVASQSAEDQRVLKKKIEADRGERGGGYTIGGDVSFYEWDFTENMPQKNQGESR